MYEFYRDIGMWAVRKVGGTNFNSQELFHVQTREEAMALSALLNSYVLSGGQLQ